MNAPSRSPLRYHGSKWRIAPWVISHFPPHRVYVEPFGGAAAVLLRKPLSRCEVWNDLNADLVNLFRVLRTDVGAAALSDALKLTPYARGEYATLYEPGLDPVDQARRFIARSFMGFASKGAEALSGFDVRINPDGYIARLASLRASAAELEVFFIDPPYLGETHGTGGTYRHDMTPAQHRKLLEALQRVAGFVVCAGYPSTLYDSALVDWQRVEAAARTDNAGARTEVLWLNPRLAAAREAAAARDLFGGVA